jgi:hypothetical protein
MEAYELTIEAKAKISGFRIVSTDDFQLYQVVPEAKILFQYRHPLAWARSFSRAFGMSDEDLSELDRLIRQADPTLAPDTILPQTIRP